MTGKCKQCDGTGAAPWVSECDEKGNWIVYDCVHCQGEGILVAKTREPTIPTAKVKRILERHLAWYRNRGASEDEIKAFSILFRDFEDDFLLLGVQDRQTSAQP